MTITNSESEKSVSSGGGKRIRAKSNTHNAYKKHVIKFRLNEKKKVHKRPLNEAIHSRLGSIEKRVEILCKEAKRMKTVPKGNTKQGIKSETSNLMTNLCVIDVNIQNIVGRDSEDIELSRLLRDVIDELMDRFIYRYPLLANVVRIPQFIQNVKSFQVPKYVVCTLLLMGSTVLKDDKFFKVFTEERRKRVLNYVTEHMEKALSNPDCLSVWTMVVLARYYTTIGILTQCTKYVHLAARLAISMRLHRVDAYSVSTAEREHEQLLVDKELKRRLWWCSYVFCVLLSEAIAAQPALQSKDIFVNLPSNDRLWHTNAKFILSKTNSANRGDMILSSKGEFRFDTFASYVILFKLRHANVAFINRRENVIAKDMDKDYQRYFKLFTDSTEFQKKVVVQFHNELKKIVTFGAHNPDIVNTMNIEYFILRHCTLILNTCIANLHLITSEVAYYEDINIPSERVKFAKLALIDNTIYFTEVFYWLLSNFSPDKFDVELDYMTSNAFKLLTNIEYIKDLNRHNAIINGKKVISEYFERLKSTFLLAKTYLYLLINISDLKKSYDKANLKFKNIPKSFEKTMLSSYDYNPWLVPNGSTYIKKACCNNASNPKIHDPFLLSRIAAKESLDINQESLSTSVNETRDKRFIMAIDLKPVVKESDELHLSLEGLSLSKQLSEKQISHTINNPTLDDDPKDFYVKDVDFDAHLQNITLLNQCKKMIERVFYPILNTGAKYMDKTQSSTFDQNLIISSYKEAFSGFNFTELLYNPIEQAQRNDAARGCELINKGNTHANFSSAVDSMGSA